MKDVIYQAQLLSIVDKTAQEIRNITEQWVLSQPSIIIDGVSYQVDPSCSTEVKELGETSCNSASESDPADEESTNVVIVVSVVSVVMVLLLIIAGLITASLCYLHKKKSESLDMYTPSLSLSLSLSLLCNYH
jgi:predicted thioredoxin/glutaredoxin